MAVVAYLSARVEGYHFNRKSDVQVAWHVPHLWFILRIYGWIDFSGRCEGVLVKGVAEAAPTSSMFKNLWLKLFGWKVGAYFTVSEEDARRGYYVGYRPTICDEQARVCMTQCHERKFMMKIGHEDCNFFAVDLRGNEIPVKPVGVWPVSDNVIQQAQAF